MMYAQMVTRENQQEFSQDLQEMFRQRYKIFVTEMGWTLPLADHRQKMEQDQFDGPDAIYVLLKDDDDALVGSLRFLPTVKPHLFSDVFPHLVDGEVIRSEDVWECSRFYTISASGAMSGLLSRGAAALGGAMAETILACGKKGIVTLANQDVLPMLLNSGSLAMPIGIPQMEGREMVSAISLQITPLGLRVYRMRRGLKQPVLRSMEQEMQVAL